MAMIKARDPEMVHVEWADYRKNYLEGLDEDCLRHARTAFVSGWEAAQGKTFESCMT